MLRHWGSNGVVLFRTVSTISTEMSITQIENFVINPCTGFINLLRHEDMKKGKAPQKGVVYNKWPYAVIPYYIDISVFSKYLVRVTNIIRMEYNKTNEIMI